MTDDFFNGNMTRTPNLERRSATRGLPRSPVPVLLLPKHNSLQSSDGIQCINAGMITPLSITETWKRFTPIQHFTTPLEVVHIFKSNKTEKNHKLQALPSDPNPKHVTQAYIISIQNKPSLDLKSRDC